MKPSVLTGSVVGLIGGGSAGLFGLTYSTMSLLQEESYDSNNLSFGSNKTLKDFKGGVCVNTSLTQAERTAIDQARFDSTQYATSNKFTAIGGSDPSKGCLAVSWDKQTWSDGYWKGTIRFEWLFSKGGETIVVHGFYSSVEDATSTDTGEDVNANWRAIYVWGNTKARIMWNKLVAGNNVSGAMPKPKAFFNGSKGDYWGFNPDYSKRCTDEKCKGSPSNTEHFVGVWKWSGNTSGSHKFFDLAETNYDVVFGNTCFPNVTSTALLKDSGTWEKFEMDGSKGPK